MKSVDTGVKTSKSPKWRRTVLGQVYQSKFVCLFVLQPNEKKSGKRENRNFVRVGVKSEMK